MQCDEPEGWFRGRLGENADLLAGFAFKSPQFTDDVSDVRLLRGDNVGQGRLRWHGARRWPAETRSEFERYELRLRDVVVAMDRPWIDAGLKFAVVRKHDLPCLLVQRVARLRGTATLLQHYLPYVIGSPAFTDYVRAVQTGTAVPHISGSQIAEFPLVLPPVAEQARIAELLGALDDKIDGNRRLGGQADELANALFWSAIRRETVESKRIEDLIIEGVVLIGDGFRAKNSELGTDGLPFARAGNLNDGFDFTRADRLPEEHAGRIPSKCSVPGDVVFTSKGTVGRFAFVDTWTEPFVYSPQLCFWRSLDHGRLPPTVLFRWMQSEEATRQINALKGQTDMADYVSLRDQRSMVISLPGPEATRRLAATLEPLAAIGGTLRSESRTLRDLRDTLLPKLMSGEIRVPDTTDPGEVIGPLSESLAPAGR